MKVTTLLVWFLFISSFSFSQEKNYTEIAQSIKTPSTTLNGTLLNINSKKKTPLVIIIPGSGPTDRDGNNAAMKNNSLKFLAEKLAENNIASYRFDKSVLSYTKEQIATVDTLTFESFITDTKAVLSYFKTSKNYSKIIVVGHSQGSLVGMIAGKNIANAFISLEGAGKTIDEILIEQITQQAPFLKDETVRVLDSLKKGVIVDDFNPMLASVFNKSVQPFLISWIKYNPQNEIKKLTIPTLIINGTKDIQVQTIDAELLYKANPNSQLFIIENMNHLLKEIKGDVTENMNSYNNPDLPIKGELITILTTFINEL